MTRSSKTLLLILFIGLCVSGCASLSAPNDKPTMASGKALLAVKATILNIHEAFRVPCQQGLVAPADCKKVDQLTSDAEPIYAAAANAAILAIQAGDDAQAADYSAKKAELDKLAVDLVALALKYQINSGGGK